jgi:hypothetical protein
MKMNIYYCFFNRVYGIGNISVFSGLRRTVGIYACIYYMESNL